MRVGFLITARLKSSRLRFKLLLPLNGYNVIERVIQRAKSVVECDDVVLCTSKLNQDLPLVRIAKKHGIYYFNGHSEDVLQRLLDACVLFNFDFFIGITADNPLFCIYHASLLSDMIRQDPDIDFLYTTGMPIGVNIYAVNVKALRTICAIKKQTDTEIWGRYLINRPEIFNVREFKVGPSFVREGYRMTLDEMEDYLVFKAVYEHFDEDQVIDVLQSFDFLDAHPEIVKLNSHIIQRDIGEKEKKEIDDYMVKNKKSILEKKQEFYLKTNSSV